MRQCSIEERILSVLSFDPTLGSLRGRFFPPLCRIPSLTLEYLTPSSLILWFVSEIQEPRRASYPCSARRLSLAATGTCDLPAPVALLNRRAGTLLAGFRGRPRSAASSGQPVDSCRPPPVSVYVNRVNQLKGREIWRPLAPHPASTTTAGIFCFDFPFPACPLSARGEPVRPAWRAPSLPSMRAHRRHRAPQIFDASNPPPIIEV